MVQRNRFDRQLVIAFGRAIGGIAVVADDTQHVFAVARIPGKRAKFAGDFRRCRIGHTGHDRCQGATHGAPFVAVIAIAHVHQQSADIGIAKPQGAEII